MRTETLIRDICAWMEHRRVSASHLASKAGLDPKTVQALRRDDARPTSRTLVRLERAMALIERERT